MKDNFDDIINIEGHVKKPLLKVIREKCLDCCVGQNIEVRLCQAKDCELWPYRMGKNPFRTYKISEDNKEAAKQRLPIKKQKAF